MAFVAIGSGMNWIVPGREERGLPPRKPGGIAEHAHLEQWPGLAGEHEGESEHEQDGEHDAPAERRPVAQEFQVAGMQYGKKTFHNES